MLVLVTLTVCYTKETVPNFHYNARFPNKTDYFSNNSNDAYKNAYGNSKFQITKLNPWKLTFLK